MVADTATGKRVLRFAESHPGYFFLNISFLITTAAVADNPKFLLKRNDIFRPISGVYKDIFDDGYGTAHFAFPVDAGDVEIFLTTKTGTVVPFQYVAFTEVFVRDFRAYS